MPSGTWLRRAAATSAMVIAPGRRLAGYPSEPSVMSSRIPKWGPTFIGTSVRGAELLCRFRICRGHRRSMTSRVFGLRAAQFSGLLGIDAARQAFAGWTEKTDRARADSAADSIRAVASVVEDDVLHQADEELGLALVLAGPIVKL